MKHRLIIILLTFILIGCTTLYKNPTGVETAEVYGSSSSFEAYKLFFQNHRKTRSISERSEKPIVILASIDGIEVNESTIPAKLTVGRHQIRFRLHDTKEYADFFFLLDAKANEIYRANYNQEVISGEITTTMWLENTNTNEVVSDKRKTIMVPFQRIAAPAVLVQ